MSQLGSLFSLTREEVDALMALPEDDRVEHMYEEIMETLHGTPRACQLDKSWLGIHRVLTGPGERDDPYDVDDKAGAEPLKVGVCGGAPLCYSDSHVLTLTTPEQAGAFVAAVAGWDEAAFNDAYDRNAAATMRSRFGDEYREFCFEYFKDLRDLHARAAAAGHHVLFSGDI